MVYTENNDYAFSLNVYLLVFWPAWRGLIDGKASVRVGLSFDLVPHDLSTIT